VPFYKSRWSRCAQGQSFFDTGSTGRKIYRLGCRKCSNSAFGTWGMAAKSVGNSIIVYLQRYLYGSHKNHTIAKYWTISKSEKETLPVVMTSPSSGYMTSFNFDASWMNFYFAQNTTSFPAKDLKCCFPSTLKQPSPKQHGDTCSTALWITTPISDNTWTATL